ncbi:hypothetical protein [Sneathiella sp.]|uniref:hypothetical protein n=1 Tax=Sneathiella sp. TaxID=1964365 RepID=UPI003569513E
MTESDDADYELVGSISQQQKRLNEGQINQVVNSYRAEATVYKLAEEFECHRNTTSSHLKTNKAVMRLTPPSTNQIDEMVRLYKSGLSLAKVGSRIGFPTQSVVRYLRERSVMSRNSHGHEAE